MKSKGYYEIRLASDTDSSKLWFFKWFGNKNLPVYSTMEHFVNGRLERIHDNISERTIAHHVGYLTMHGWHYC